MTVTTRVAILTPGETTYGRQVQHGIVKYAFPARPWLLTRRVFKHDTRDWLKRWGVQGIIGHITSQPMMDCALSLDVPVVNVSGRLADGLTPCVYLNDQAIAEVAARHFLDRGFRSAGYVGFLNFALSHRRKAAFKAAMSAGGVDVFDAFEVSDPGATPDEDSWHELDDELIEWLQRLAKPTAIFACNDALGRQVSEACRLAALRIPDDVALLGCDNDDLLCRMAQPGLSSIDLPIERVGYEAAALLDRLMAGEQPAAAKEIGEADEIVAANEVGSISPGIRPARGDANVAGIAPVGDVGAAAGAPRGAPLIVRLPPVGVVCRTSTEVLSINDAAVAGAVRFIREHAGETIGVREVVLAGKVDRRTLERRFRQSLRRSILEEIRRVRLESAKEMLANTDLPMPVVAQRSGFTDAKQLSLVFHEEVGTQPTSYRRQFRLHEPIIE